jgi:exosortase B
MDGRISPAAAAAPSKMRRWLPASSDLVVLGLLAAAFLAIYGPTYSWLSRTIWATDEQGHGPIILAASFWLLYQKREALARLPTPQRAWPGWAVLGVALFLFAFGHSQGIVIVEVGSQIAVLAGLLLLFKGRAGLRLCWFPLFFLIFMVPLPSPLVAAVTTPLKSAVSAVASDLLYRIGYPIGRSGVVLNIGQYQLLVADACAGLNSMFTLEALVLLYMNIMGYKSVLRNVLLGLAAIPISFCANIVRVCILVLVTYYFGDSAGQGFMHGFAGMVLFLVALMLTLLADGAFGQYLRWRERRVAGAGS